MHVLPGFVLAAAGAALLSLLVLVSNCSAAVCERWTIRVGLAGGAVMTMLGEAGIIIGWWLVWRAWRSPPRT